MRNLKRTMGKQSRNPRILFGVTSDGSLGLMNGLGDYLSSLGWDVHIVSAPSGSTVSSGSEQVTNHAIKMKREPSPLHDIMSLVSWLRLVVKVKPDVVSVGTPKAGLLGTLASYLVRVPRRVYHLRGLRLETERGVRQRVLRLLEKITSAAATDVLAVSPSLREEAITLDLVSEQKVTCLGRGSSNGIDLDRFYPGNIDATELQELRQQHSLSTNLPIIGFVGRQTYDKGIYELATASRELYDRGLDHQLLIIGPTDQGLPTDFWDEIGLIGKRSPVIVGRAQKVERYYALMDVLALPTYREGMPNVVLEAAACGVPTVTTNATGARDAVADGVTGFQIGVGDSESLVDALGLLLGNNQMRESMGHAASRFVRKNFDRFKVWENLANYYAPREFHR